VSRCVAGVGHHRAGGEQGEKWMQAKSQMRGVTLIELMIVVAVVAALMLIAIPSYRSYVLRANRAEGRAALLSLGAAQEKFYLQCNTYSTTISTDATDCAGPNLQFNTTSERGYYTVAVTAADTNAWTATATAVAGQPQIDDTKCRVFQLTSAGVKTSTNAGGATTTSECWDR
jgi:type IV pilus assembly protein PilE